MSLRILTTLALPLALTSQGCTLIGVGIGAASPKYDERSAAASWAPAAPAQGRDAAPRGDQQPPATATAPEAPGARTRVGSYWLEGLMVGAAVDAMVLTMVVLAAGSHRPSIDTDFR